MALKRVTSALDRLRFNPLSAFHSSSPRESQADAVVALDELIAEIAELQKVVVQELQDRRARLSRELSWVEAELADLTEQPELPKKTRSNAPVAPAREIGLSDLVAALEAAPDHILNIRKANLELRNIKRLAKANPHQLQLGGKGAWPTVMLLKQPTETSNDSEVQGVPQGMFDFEDATFDPPAKKAR
jgi:hypothetical protein